MHLTTTEFEGTRPATTEELATFALNWDMSRWEFRCDITDDPHPQWWVIERGRED